MPGIRLNRCLFRISPVAPQIVVQLGCTAWSGPRDGSISWNSNGSLASSHFNYGAGQWSGLVVTHGTVSGPGHLRWLRLIHYLFMTSAMAHRQWSHLVAVHGPISKLVQFAWKSNAPLSLYGIYFGASIQWSNLVVASGTVF